MDIDIEIHEKGTVLPVKAQPGSRKNEIRGAQNGALKVSVTQIPEKGKANKVIAEFIAKSLGLRKSQVVLLSGETSSLKKFLLENVAPLEVKEKLIPFLKD